MCAIGGVIMSVVGVGFAFDVIDFDTFRSYILRRGGDFVARSWQIVAVDAMCVTCASV